LLAVAKELRITQLSATNVNNIKNKAQWESALNKIENNFTVKAKVLPKTSKSYKAIPSVKELIRKLKPLWK
jgi:hypothetical protein